MRKCPKCNAYDVELYMYQSVEVIKCKSCGFDGGEVFEQAPTEKASQKAKGRYNPYKAGGTKRTIKK